MKKKSILVSSVVPAILSLVIASPALAVSPGNGDVSDAMRYDTSAPFGTILPNINDDDEYETVAAAFPINFFGAKMEAICVTDNGGIFPVPTTSDTCSTSYNEDVYNLTLDSEQSMISATGADLYPNKPDNCTTLASATTFGTACSVYSGTTTVDGKDAMVFTWYRLPMYDNGVDLSNFVTFQVLIIKLDTPDSSNGYDIQFEFNYGAVNDSNGGYSATDPSTACDFSTDLADCRFGMGLGKYSTPGVPDGEATGYEFVSQYSTAELLDGGTHALVSNSMNSDVAGRYICSMVSGDQVGCDGKTPDPELPNTGADSASMSTFGLGAAVLVVVGIVLVARRRNA